MLDITFPNEKQIDMPSLNHSYICSRILRQLFALDNIEVLTELTIDIENGLTPDISVYPAQAIQPNFSRDMIRFPILPILAIEVISPRQAIQDILEKAEKMVHAGVKAVWAVEPYTKAIFVVDQQGEQIFYNQTVTSEDISVDFAAIFK